MYKEEQLQFLKKKHYLAKGETLDQRIKTIGDVVRTYEVKYNSPGLGDRIESYVQKQIYCPSTPQLANFGKYEEEGTSPLNCSCNIITVPNSIQGIYYSIGETAMLSKLGAGVGATFIKITDKNTLLSEGFYSNSKLDWAEDLVRTSQKVSQSSIRRGYSVPFFSIEDAEFYDVLKRADKKNPDKKDPFVDNNIGFILPSGFRDKLKTDKECQKRFMTILQARRDSGKIYLLDVDNCNKNQSEVYKKLGHIVDSTNICCVTGDQMVATEDGFKTVKELSELNTPLRLFDNEKVNESTAMLFRGHADVYTITLENGMTHTITSNHDLVVRDKSRKTYHQSIDTGLVVGKKVCIQSNKGLFGKRNEPGLAFLLGLFLGDGNEQGKNGIRISVWENDFDLIEEVESICEEFYNRGTTVKHDNNLLPKFNEVSTGDSLVKRKNLHTTIFNTNGFEFKKGTIPSWILNANEETHWQLIRGLLYSDGTIGSYNTTGKSFGQPINLSLASIDLDLLKVVQLITSNLGLKCKIYGLRKGGVQTLPKNNGSGEYGEYNTKNIYRLVLSNKNDLLLLNSKTGFLNRKNIILENKNYRDNSHKSSKIISIDYAGKEDVYCPTVDSIKHLWVCNGVITSNTEAITPSYEDKTFTCHLASLNLVHWDTIKNDTQIIKDAVTFLDIQVEEYIKLTEGVPFLEKARKSAIDKRDIGLGTLGFHDYIQSKGCAYGDIKSRILNKEIYSTIRKYAIETSQELAELLGRPLLCEQADVNQRNVSLMMVAPNKSSSFIYGNTSLGIEAFMSNYFVKALAGIQITFKNHHLEALLESKGMNTTDVWDSILNNIGSVQHLDFLSKDEKNIFLTASEISPKDLIDLASDRQKFIDMGQSLNLFNRPNYTMKDIYDIHKYAFDKDIKTLYYYYPQIHAAYEKNGADWDTCVSCAD